MIQAEMTGNYYLAGSPKNCLDKPFIFLFSTLETFIYNVW